jgi:hypothetical protein
VNADAEIQNNYVKGGRGARGRFNTSRRPAHREEAAEDRKKEENLHTPCVSVEEEKNHNLCPGYFFLINLI